MFRWLRNDKMVSEGPKEIFEAASVAENEVVTVEVIPYDGDGAGEPGALPPCLVATMLPTLSVIRT